MKRIKFNQIEDVKVSIHTFKNETKEFKVVLVPKLMKFYFTNPVNNDIVYESNTPRVNNLEVLQRHIKKQLRLQLGIEFEKEKRNVR